MSNVIPPMTDPLGRHWKQPSLDNLLIDDEYALMDRHSFDELANYSSTIPSGVYPGKMWKAVSVEGTAQLRWFGIVEGKPDVCSNNWRKILIVEKTKQGGQDE